MSENETDKWARAREQALAQFASIRSMVATLEASRDEDAFEAMAAELARDAGFEVIGGGGSWSYRSVNDGADEDAEVYESEEDAWVGCCEGNDLRPDEDEARRAIEEDALSVEVRSDWHVPGDTAGASAAEFCILLCTGGPAVRIRGELDEHGEPSRAWLECQDWFVSWQQVVEGVDQDTLLTYARCFWFGEG